LIGYI